jgi:hypothetical protein
LQPAGHYYVNAGVLRGFDAISGGGGWGCVSLKIENTKNGEYVQSRLSPSLFLWASSLNSGQWRKQQQQNYITLDFQWLVVARLKNKIH